MSTVSTSTAISPPEKKTRRYPIGAELLDGVVSFRVWAPAQQNISVVLIDGGEHAMQPESTGYFRLDVIGLAAGALYRFRLGDIAELAADPASRFQPHGPSEWSMVVDPDEYAWTDVAWAGIGANGQVLYELHVGTFTQEGTYAAAAQKLTSLKDVGVTCVELMPLNEFCGDFGWGYDGFLPYAPTRLYGTPNDLRAFINKAHGLGIGVILDVVYNHFGAGERYKDFTPDYFTDRYWNEWGSSINFDGQNSAGVREFVSKNAAYWIDEYHMDGLRLDATQALNDNSDEHIMAIIGREARAAAGHRSIYLVAENEPQDTRLVRSSEMAGYGLDALWNDDFHHSAMVALTGRNEAYYHDHLGSAQEFVSAAKYGYLFQGQRYDWQDAARGQPAFDLNASNFVHFLQNHDQIANSGSGQRMDKMATPARVRALTALLLLGPQTPMLFQGQEFGASSPFFYFADQRGDLIEVVRRGRIDFLKQFPSLNDDEFARRMPIPAERSTFERSKLDWSECDEDNPIFALHRDLIKLRKDTAAIARGQGKTLVDGSTIGAHAFLLRYIHPQAENECVVIINLGPDLPVSSFADPLFAPPAGRQWDLAWSSEDPLYGGSGRRGMDLQRRWTIPADCALLLRPIERDRHSAPDPVSLQNWQAMISNTDASV